MARNLRTEDIDLLFSFVHLIDDCRNADKLSKEQLETFERRMDRVADILVAHLQEKVADREFVEHIQHIIMHRRAAREAFERYIRNNQHKIFNDPRLRMLWPWLETFLESED